MSITGFRKKDGTVEKYDYASLDNKPELTLGIDEDDGLLYIYVDGVKQGEGVEIGGPVGTRYTITYNLDPYMQSSNNAARILEGNAYHTSISSSHVDYQVEDITVTMGGTNITNTAVNGNDIDIASVTGNIAITVTALYFASVETDNAIVKIQSGGSGTFGVRLHAIPTQTQNVSVFSDGVTVSPATLTFTASNWNTYQYVTVTAGDVDEDAYYYVSLINSDPLLTESTVLINVTELGYNDLVDTTIPTANMHTVTLDDFSDSKVFNNYIRLYGYNAEYTNIKIPATLNDKIPWIACTNTGPSASNATFSSGNTTIQYVTFEDGVICRGAGQTSGINGDGLFLNCTNLIGVSNIPVGVTSMKSAFSGCTSLKFVDNLDKLVNVTDDFSQTFLNCTALEYVQDLSGLDSGLYRTFRECTSLKKIFGLPQPTSAKTFQYAFMQTQVEKVVIPENASSLIYAFSGNTHVNHVEILADGLETSSLTSIFGTPTQNINVYANEDSTTIASLRSMFSSSNKVTVYTLGGASLPSIVVWGDSTSSPNRSWIEWPKRLQTKLGVNDFLVKNEAVSGEWTTSTSARQGGNAIHTNAFTIPADATATLVELTTQDNQTFSAAPIFSAGGSFNPCKIGDVEGVISRDGANYYFTRSSAGNSVLVTSRTTVISEKDTEFNAVGNIMLIQLGDNAGWSGTPSVLLNQIQLMVNHFLAAGGEKYIVSGPWSGTWITTADGWETTQAFAALAANAFGNHWLDLPQDMASNSQTDNPDWTPTSDDLTNIAAGKTPMSLTWDNTHPNEYGANSMMMGYYRKGVVLGYWS